MRLCFLSTRIRNFADAYAGEAGGLASTTKEYAERSMQELLGASLALDAAIGAMVAKK